MAQEAHPNMETPATPAPVQYDRMMVVLHWLLALGLIYQLGLGLWMDELPKEPVGYRAQWFNLHKSIGMCLGLLILWRLGWRVTHSVPVSANASGTWQHKLSLLTHRAMYACMFLMPLSGFLGSNFSQYPIKFFGWALPKWFAPDPDMKSLLSEVHELTATVFMALVALHFAAVLWHVWVKRDGLLRRMAWGRANHD
jgi:cytochrome b561